jgi:hypothetical protein
MDDKSFNTVFHSLEKLIKKNPNDKSLKKSLNLLIKEKSEYDRKKLDVEKELAINNQNHTFAYCMNYLNLNSLYNFCSNGYVKTPISFPQFQIEKTNN